MAIELQPLVLESTLTMQKILEANDHTERLQLVKHFVIAETKRLNTKKAIKGMFSGVASSTTTTSAIPAEEQISTDDVRSKRKDDNKGSSSASSSSSSTGNSSFFADDDAFQ